MTPKGKREIVVEYEQIRLIRKRARTALAHCDKCGTEADFVRLTDAAAISVRQTVATSRSACRHCWQQ